MILEKETALFNDGAIAALEELATGKSTVFYQASAPAVAGRKVNDIWFDTDDGNTMYRFNGTTWAKQQFGDAAIVAGSITAAKINTQDLYTNFLVTYILNAAQASISSLSAITADIGEVTAGVLKSANYAAPTSATGDYSAAGMLIDLTNGVIRTKNFAVLADGSAHINTSLTLGGANNASGVLTVKDATGATIGTWDKDGINTNAGHIGGWDIDSTRIYSDATLSGVTYGARMQRMSGTTASRLAFYIVRTEDGTTTCPFLVRYNGAMEASSINGSFTVSPTSYVTITRSAGQSAHPSMLTLNDLTDNYTADLRASQLALKPSSSSIYTATLNAIGGGQLILNSTANQLYGIRLIANSSYTSGEYVPQMILQGTTSATVSTNSSNPRITFSNVNASQSLALIFTDQDSVQAPASLTLAGNQGGEYFIAPNIKVTSGLEVGAAKFYTPSEVTATTSGSYITSGTITVRRRGNVAHIYGNITIGSAVASQTTIATIPDGYRPITTDFFAATNGSFFRVNSNGTIQAQNALTAGNYYFSTTYPLS